MIILKKVFKHTETCRFTLQSSQLINNLSTQVTRWVWCDISTFIRKKQVLNQECRAYPRVSVADRQ